LLDLDQRLQKVNVKYFRYMDDVLILAPPRGKLREAIRVRNQMFSALGWNSIRTRPVSGA